MADDIFVADSHALVWYFTEDARLSRIADEALTKGEAGEVRVLVPTIVLAEILYIAERQRAQVNMDEVLHRLRASPGFVIVPFDVAVFEEMLGLPASLEIHDRILAATARVYGAKIITADAQLQASGVIEFVW